LNIQPVSATAAVAASVAIAAGPRSVLPQGQPAVVDYAMLAALTGRQAGYSAPAPYVARQNAYATPAAYPVQQIGSVTVDYSVLQN
jgi:hypothetical protein